MREFLSFSNLELDFLSLLGIQYDQNRFYNTKTKNSFICRKTSNGPVKEFDYGENFLSYDFIGRDGTITFFRTNIDVGENIPSLIVRMKGYAIAIGESYHNVQYRALEKEQDSEKCNIRNELRNITIQIKNKKNQYTIKIIPAMSVNPAEFDVLSNTYIFDNYNKYNIIASVTGTMTSVIQDLKGNKEVINGTERYEDILISTINVLFKDNLVVKHYFLSLVPLFVNIYNNTLYFPSIAEEYYQSRFRSTRNDIEDFYQKTIREAEEKCQKSLLEIDDKEEKFNSIIKKYSLNQEKNQK